MERLTTASDVQAFAELIHIMDLWDLKKWRKKLALNQSEAAEKLGVGRGALQNWERELRPVPKTVELACEELARLADKAPNFGPVLLVSTKEPVVQQLDGRYRISLQHLGLYESNDAAIEAARNLKSNSKVVDFLIFSTDGTIIWDIPELSEETRLAPSKKIAFPQSQ